jgi:hypothetical protein
MSRNYAETQICVCTVADISRTNCSSASSYSVPTHQHDITYKPQLILGRRHSIPHSNSGRCSCCRAANWQFPGRKQGRDQDNWTHRFNTTLQDVLGLPLLGDFRKRLLAG